MHAPYLSRFFAGWKLESGLRYRSIVQIADFEAVRGGDFKWRHVKEVHEKEVHFPAEVDYPFAMARDEAIAALKPSSAVVPPVPEVPPLPFDWEIGKAPVVKEPVAKPAKIVPRVVITSKRIFEYDPTDGCEACLRNAGLTTGLGVKYKVRTDESKERCLRLLDSDASGAPCVVEAIEGDLDHGQR